MHAVHAARVRILWSLTPPCPNVTALLQAWYTGEGALGSLQKFSNGF